MALAGTGGAETAWARRRIAWSSALLLVGVFLCVAVDQTLGGWVTVAAFAALVHALHRFGRSGPG